MCPCPSAQELPSSRHCLLQGCQAELGTSFVSAHARAGRVGRASFHSPWDSVCHLVDTSKTLPPGAPGNPVFSNCPRRRVRCPAPRETYAHVLPYFSCRKARLSRSTCRPFPSLAWLLLWPYLFLICFVAKLIDKVVSLSPQLFASHGR